MPLRTQVEEPELELINLHIGGKEVKQGWKILNALPGPGVDYLGNMNDLSQFADQSVGQIYASHVLEHSNQLEVLDILKGFYRVLAPQGKLMISVPHLETLCRMFIHPNLDKAARFHIMRMIYGGQTTAYDFHYIGFNLEFLQDYLQAAGFKRIAQVEGFNLFNDTSEFAPYGVKISLNVIAYKD